MVHSSKEFVPGLLYVAMSRVLSADTLQVIGFSRSQVIPAAPEVIIQCHQDPGKSDPALWCCRKKAIGDERFFDVHYRFAAVESRNGDNDCYEFPIEVSDSMVQSYFEREDTHLKVTVAQLLEHMENHESELSCLPTEDLDTTCLLRK